MPEDTSNISSSSLATFLPLCTSSPSRSSTTNNIRQKCISTNTPKPNRSDSFPGTKLGKAVLQVLGDNEEVRSLDKTCHLAKQHANDKALQDIYLEKLVVIQARVSQKHGECMQKFREWDYNFFLNEKNDLASPSDKDIKKDKAISELLRKIKYAEALMKEWKISF